MKSCTCVLATRLRGSLGLLLGILFLVGMSPSARATTVTVDTATAPDMAGDNKCGLVEAVAAVNQQSTVDACTFAPNGSADTIAISVPGTHSLPAGLTLTRGATITGISSVSTTLTSGAFCAVCFAGDLTDSATQLNLSNLTVQYVSGSSSASGVNVSSGSRMAGLFLDHVRVTGFPGSGVRLEGSQLFASIANSTIESNANGVSVFLAALLIEDTTIRNNTAHGLFGSYSGDAPSGYIFMSRDTIQNNQGSSGGAGILLEHSSGNATEPLLFIEQSTISGNRATSGNGGGISTSANISILGTTIENNKADSGIGGGIFAKDGPANRDVRIDGSTLRNNTAARGGGIGFAPLASSGTHLYLQRSTIGPGNAATLDGGGIYSNTGQFERVENVTISGNTAGARGGGIFLQGGAELHLTHTTIVYNTAAANGANGGGGGIYFEGATNVFRYNIIARNKSGGAPNIKTSNMGATTAYNLLDDVTGANGVFPTASSGGTNKVANPVLDVLPLKNMGGLTAVLAPMVSSPVIDAIPSAEEDDVTVDQRDQSRPLDGDNVAGALKDIGAVEARRSQLFEAEWMSVPQSSLDNFVTDRDSNYSGGSGKVLQGNAPGDFVTFASDIIQPGTYTVIARFKKASNAAKFSLAVGTTASVSPPIFTSVAQDSYALSPTVTSAILGTITVSSAGSRYFKFTALSNPISGGYWIFIDAIWLVRTS